MSSVQNSTDPAPAASAPDAIPALMNAAVLRSTGIDGLVLERIRTPVPGPGEVLVRVAACGVCHTDLHVIKGEVAFPRPAVLGHEISGTVVAAGPGSPVAEQLVGRPVVGAFIMPCGECRACAAGRDDLCGPFFAMNRLRGVLYDGRTRLYSEDGDELAMYSMGGLAEYAVIPVTGVAPLPGHLPLVEAAVLGCAALTAYGAVRWGADVRVGETVAVTGVGGVGSNIVQIARSFGAARVIAIDISDDKLRAATELGATDTVHAANHDPAEAVLALTEGGVDVAFEALGRPATFEQSVRMLADGGRLVAVGIADGDATAGIPITRLVRRSQRIIGSYGARTRTDLPRVIDMTARGAIQPQQVVTRRYALQDAARAYADLNQGAIIGRAVVCM